MKCVLIFHKTGSNIRNVFHVRSFFTANSKKKCRFACFLTKKITLLTSE